MLTKIIKTYACKKATPNSNNKTKNKITDTKKKRKIFNEITCNKNPAIKNTKVCPANILAHKRTAKLKHLIAYEKISIGINKNNKKKGASGIKNFKNFIPYNCKPIKKKEIQIVNDKKKIKTKWLVNAIPKGINPKKLESKIKINKVKKKGKYIIPFLPTCCSIISKIKLYKFSNKHCQFFGIKYKFLSKIK